MEEEESQAYVVLKLNFCYAITWNKGRWFLVVSSSFWLIPACYWLVSGGFWRFLANTSLLLALQSITVTTPTRPGFNQMGSGLGLLCFGNFGSVTGQPIWCNI